jgi:hypothetical protein
VDCDDRDEPELAVDIERTEGATARSFDDKVSASDDMVATSDAIVAALDDIVTVSDTESEVSDDVVHDVVHDVPEREAGLRRASRSAKRFSRSAACFSRSIRAAAYSATVLWFDRVERVSSRVE